MGARFGLSQRAAAYLSIAVETIVAVVKPTAARPIGNAENTINGADCATNTCPNCSANKTADGARHPITFVSTLLCAAHDALRETGFGKSQKRERERRACKISFAIEPADRVGVVVWFMII
jgi:hypothetical protein